MTNLVTELRPALRRLAREPGFTVLATAVLAVGIGIVATVFALVEGILIRPLPYPDAARLVSVRHVAPAVDFTRDGVSPGIFLHYRDGNRVFDGIAAYSPESGILTVGDRAEPILTSRVSSGLFDLLGVVPRLGRLPGAEDHTFDYTAGTGTLPGLISHDLWVRRFGADPEVLGRALELDGHSFAVVVGVAPAGFAFPDPATEAWIVMEHDAAPWSASAAVRNGMTLSAIARLRPGRSLEDAETGLNRLVGLLPDAFGDITGEDLRKMEPPGRSSDTARRILHCVPPATIVAPRCYETSMHAIQPTRGGGGRTWAGVPTWM